MKSCDSILGFLAHYEGHRLYKSSKEGLFFQTYPFILLDDLGHGSISDKVLVHELAHCWHLYGSTLGGLFNFLACDGIGALFDYIDGQPMYRNKPLPVKTPIFEDEDARDWFHSLTLFHLFKHGFFIPEDTLSLSYFPRNKDFIDSFCCFIENTKEMYQKRNPGAKIQANYENFIVSLAFTSDKSINSIHTKYPKFNKNYHPGVNANLIMTEDLVEDYARLVETIYMHGGLDTTAFKEIYDSMLHAQGHGESFRVYCSFFYGPDKDDYLRMLINYIMILELSLMTPFHPYCLFEKPYRLKDLYPPLRFTVLIESFGFDVCDALKAKSLKDVNKEKFLIMADWLCDKHKWPSFRGMLQAAKEYYQNERAEGKPDKYLRDIGEFIIGRKLNACIIDFEALKQTPVKVIRSSEKVIEVPEPDQPVFYEFLCHFLYEPFGIDLILNYDYNQTNKAFEYIESFISKPVIEALLADETLTKFKEENLHLNPFVSNNVD